MVSLKYLYIFPHPDDESFGPAAAMHRQLSRGDEVHLLTLTQGGATRQRFKLGLTVEEMGRVRYEEMVKVKDTLGLTGMEVLDLPDGGLKDLDPRMIEKIVEERLTLLKPDVVVTYPVHGISGFHDHLVTHAVVKRVWLELRPNPASGLKRLAFFTLPEPGGPVFLERGMRIRNSAEEDIDCVMKLNADELDALEMALSCYPTYKETIRESRILEKIGDTLYFELFDEQFQPQLDDLHLQLPE